MVVVVVVVIVQIKLSLTGLALIVVVVLGRRRKKRVFEIRVCEDFYYYEVIFLPEFCKNKNIISRRAFCLNYPRVLQIQVKISFIVFNASKNFRSLVGKRVVIVFRLCNTAYCRYLIIKNHLLAILASLPAKPPWKFRI